jgi:hypothetical protein
METKNQNFKMMIGIILLVVCFMKVTPQSKQRMGVISMDVKGLNIDNAMMTGLVNLEIEKTNRYELYDKYDVTDVLMKNQIDINSCFGKSCMVRVGKILNSDKMLTGSVEKIGNKIILILRLVDVQTETIETTSVMEFIDQQNEIQRMVQLSVNNLIGIQNDQKVMDLLVNFQEPISSPKTIVKLNGPRMGAAITFGNIGKRMGESRTNGGYNMFPVTSMFGYQWEKQYLSAGEFQALIEVIGAINGMESGTFVPSMTFLNGFRFNKSGWEIGLGPVFRMSKLAKGYYDTNGEWKLLKYNREEAKSYNVIETIDWRGETIVSSGLIIAIGKTFHSGYLNVPLNLYVSPRKDGTVVGMNFGFNIAKIPRKWQ